MASESGLVDRRVVPAGAVGRAGDAAADGIRLWWIGERPGDTAVLEEARVQVERAFGLPARLLRSPERPTGTLDPARGQHLSAAILRWLTAVRAERAGKLLALTDVDLFIPILTFVFGEAKLGGDVAVVSTARLASRPDGRPAERRLLAARLAKECVHELGHTFGLLHCADAQALQGL